MSEKLEDAAERHKILSDEEVQETVEQMASLRRASGRQPDADLEAMIRFMPVAACLRDGREERGLSLQHVGQQLNASQEDLHDLEGGRLAGIDGRLLHAYVEFLGKSSWFARWKTANPELTARLGV